MPPRDTRRARSGEVGGARVSAAARSGGGGWVCVCGGSCFVACASVNVGGGWGQSLLAKDLAAKTRAVELALARGANILDAVMSRKHDRETELDSRCRDMYIAQHEVPARARPWTQGPRPPPSPAPSQAAYRRAAAHTHTHTPPRPRQPKRPSLPLHLLRGGPPQRSSLPLSPACLHPSQQVPSS